MLPEVSPECWSGIQASAKLHALLETCLCMSPTCPLLPGLCLTVVISACNPRAGEGALRSVCHAVAHVPEGFPCGKEDP